MVRNNRFSLFGPQLWIWMIIPVFLAFSDVPGVEADPCVAATFSFNECILQLEQESKDVLDIDFSRRGLTVIPDNAFQKFTNLASLDLSFNKLTTVPAGLIDKHPELKKLWLNDNLIVSFGDSAVEWQTFLATVKPEVHLGGNRFVCNCSMTWIIDILVADEVVKNGDQLRCADPPERRNLLLKDMPATVDAACKGTLSTSITNYCGDTSMFPCETNPFVGIPVDTAKLCVPLANVCDGIPQCYNRQDENPFICNRAQSVTPPNELSGVKNPDLLDYVARKYAARLYPTPSSTAATPVPNQPVLGCRRGLFECFSGSMCISQLKVCDGTIDCPDGADEEVQNCPGIPRSTVPPLIFSHAENSALNRTLTFDALEVKEMPRMHAPYSPNLAVSRGAVFPTDSARVTSLSIDAKGNLVSRSKTSDIASWELSDAPSVPPTESATHPTMTFPRMLGSAHVNNFGANNPVEENNFQLNESDTVMETVPTASQPPKKNMHSTFIASPLLDESVCHLQPCNLSILSHQNNELKVSWTSPRAARGGAWNFVAYSLECEIQRSGSGRRKRSPLLSTLVHEYTFQNVYQDDSLRIVVNAVYQDSEHHQYVYPSEPLVKADAKSQAYEKKEAAAMPSAKHVNYPGKMGFEDVMGIAVGGSLAALMALLLGVYVFRRRHSIFPKSRAGTNGRPLKMRKVDSKIHTKMNDRTLSNEPIYSEPEYLQYGSEPLAAEDLAGKFKGHGTMRSAAAMAMANPEDSYVQVLGSDSSVYGAAPSRACSEYSCYSISAGINPVLASSRLLPASLPPTSEYGSLADNCSVGYYYHNSGLMPRCVHPEQNFRHFGDTLTPSCHIPTNGHLTLSSRNFGRNHFGNVQVVSATNPALAATMSSSSS